MLSSIIQPLYISEEAFYLSFITGLSNVVELNIEKKNVPNTVRPEMANACKDHIKAPDLC